MSSSEYLNYESGKFSKTRGVGIFGNDCQDMGIPADCWRFYLYYNRPEKSDYEFTWAEFQQLLNRELIGNLGNLVNRTLSFLQRFFKGQLLGAKEVRQYSEIVAFCEELRRQQGQISKKLEWCQLKDGLHHIMGMAAYGNKVFQEKEPWALVKNDAALAQAWLTALVYLVHDLSICLRPYLPQTAEKIVTFLGLAPTCFDWHKLGAYERLYTGKTLPKPAVLFQPLGDQRVAELRLRFAGNQNERAEVSGELSAQVNKQLTYPRKQETVAEPDFELWAKSIELRVGRIVEITLHPEAERLFIEKIDCGEELPRTIVSGLAEHYQVDELLGQNVAVVANLKPAKLRGVKSMGMILAASPCKNEEDQARANGCHLVEVLHPPGEPGDRIVVQGFEAVEKPAKLSSIDDFFAVPLLLQEGRACLQNSAGGPGLSLLVQSASGSMELYSRQLQRGNIS